MGYPLWWLLGVTAIVPLICAVAMVSQLLRQRQVHLPRGFAFWAMFLVWAGLGAVLVFADVPGTVPGGGASRLVVFGYRFLGYLIATAFLLWTVNVSQRVLSNRTVRLMMSWLFVVTVIGGLAGVLIPTVELRSALELVLPGGFRQNALVKSLVHPSLAEVQTVLGRPEARPMAPYAYSNSWGSMLALLLPFFVTVLRREWAGVKRWLAMVVLAVSAVPIVYSLNRGLWICLTVGIAGALVLLVIRGRPLVLAGVGTLVVVGLVGFALSPLGALFQERLDHQHSNDRRGELVAHTVETVADNSFFAGFGGTRDLQGNFTSIAGGSTPDCQSCGVPPLGTQGHLWALIFAQGFLGAGFFLALLAVALTRSWRCRTSSETICTFVLVFTVVQLLVYDLNGVPLITILIAYACVAREQRLSGLDQLASGITWSRLHEIARRAAPAAVAGTVAGAALGFYFSFSTPPTYSARISLLLAPSPVSLVTQVLDAETRPEEVTRDTEAALVLSEASLGRVVGADVDDIAKFRQRVTITVAPNTTVMTIEVRASSQRLAESQAVDLGASYLETRRQNLEASRDQLLGLMDQQLIALESALRELVSTRRVDAVGRNEAERQQSLTELQNARIALQLTRTTAGEVVREPVPFRLARPWQVPVSTGAGLGLLAGLSGSLLFGRGGVVPSALARRRREKPVGASG